VFLSGNGPLIQVLQYALKNRVFVQPVRNFYLQHQVRRQTAPTEHMIVFDEAQRAWDADRVAEKYGIDRAAGGAVLRIAERIPDWSVVVALIGEGQEVHVGEENDIDQWQVGLQQSDQLWQVHCPKRYKAVFAEISHKLDADAPFDLITSLHTHRAEAVQDWINQLLLGNLDAAATLSRAFGSQAFGPISPAIERWRNVTVAIATATSPISAMAWWPRPAPKISLTVGLPTTISLLCGSKPVPGTSTHRIRSSPAVLSNRL